MRSTNGRLKHGDIAAVAETEGVQPSTVSRTWTRAKTEEAHTGRFASPSRRHRSGCRPADHTATLERLRGVVERSTVRSAAAACGMAPATLFPQLRLGRLRVHTSVTKPLLTEANRVQRMQFALSHIQRDTMLFDDMLDAVHVDEKLFYITQPTRRFLLLQGEVAPVRRLRSRRYITRVMFLAAIARPRYDPTTNQFFDVKLGIWPFVEHVPVQRSSRHRPAGTFVTKDVSVTKKTYRDMLISNLLPVLRELWPAAVAGNHVVVQQDNAPAHIPEADAAFAEAARASGCKVVLRNQPPNSPYMNVNDLGLFSAVQAPAQEACPHHRRVD
ncbi:unnamed protein product [Phytophthora fragariaefolia]|uniref:Unnamed protein product n=1 Tax=Phytophthora fragariaefolia TaxID=1490495 RepID=A0A9W6TQ70_9STRA|nr:unnamed protein product [Phytophthora fragariaefolia]